MDNRLAKELYHQYTNLGINAEVKGILKNIPERYRRPIEYTLSTNILGAYAISTYAILPKYVKPKKRKIITASIELLFTLSMMYDDIFDGDEQRFKFPTAWKKYGKNLTNKAVKIGINEIEKFLKAYCGKMTAKKLIDCVNRGIISTKNHKKLTLNTSLKKILRNYTERSDFVTRFPIEITFSKKDANKNIAIKALSHLYLGGQILNDLKDLKIDRTYLREGYSDIKNKQPTIPIIILYRKLNKKDRKFFESIWGHKKLSQKEKSLLNKLIKKSRSIKETIYICERYFKQSLNEFKTIADKKYLRYINKIIKSKINNLNNIIALNP